MRTDREAWADVVKGVGILLVVFGHVWRGLYNADVLGAQPAFEIIDRAIYLFHMPLFFFVAGVFFKADTSLRTFFVRSGERILYPLLLWSYLLAFALLAAQDVTNRGATTLVETVLFPLPPKDIFWFLWALFLIQTTAFAWLKLPEAARGPTLVVLLGGCMVIASSGRSSELLAGAVYHLAFFLFGLALRRGIVPLGVGAVPAAMGLALVVAAQAALFAADGVEAYLPRLVLASAALLGIVLATHWLSERFVRSRLLHACALLGAMSLPIYLAHTFFLAGARIVLLGVGIEDLTTHLVVGNLAGVAGPIALYAAAVHLQIDRALGFGPVRPALPLAAAGVWGELLAGLDHRAGDRLYEVERRERRAPAARTP